MCGIIIRAITDDGVSHKINDKRNAVIRVRARRVVKAVSKRMDCRQMIERCRETSVFIYGRSDRISSGAEEGAKQRYLSPPLGPRRFGIIFSMGGS